MNTKAIYRYAPLSAQKGRLVANAIRGMAVEKAQLYLAYTPKKAARIFKKVLDSAVANAEHNDGANIDELKVAEVFVDEGPSLKRFHARARGRGNRITKRQSHITIKVASAD